MDIFLTASPVRIAKWLLISQFDNLGKGSSGAAVQCMNIMLGLPENGCGLEDRQNEVDRNEEGRMQLCIQKYRAASVQPHRLFGQRGALRHSLQPPESGPGADQRRCTVRRGGGLYHE